MSVLRRRIGPHATRVVVISSLVLAAFVLVWAITSSSRGAYEMKAEFDDVRGLIPGGEVRAGAVPVGEVTSVDLSEEDVPLVTFTVKDDFTLHEGATADIRLGSNVGAVNRAIELTEGDVTTPELEEGTVLHGEDTDQPVNFDLAVQTLNPQTRDDIKAMLIGLDEAIKGRGGDFDRTLETSAEAVTEAGLLLKQVNEDGAALRTLIGEGQRVVSALASDPDALGEAADRTALLLATTGNRQAELSESIRALGPALVDGRQLLDRLAAAAPNLREFVTEARPAITELQPLARLLPDATDATGPFLEETRRLVERGPSDLRNFAPIIQAATPVTEQLLDVTQAGVGPLGQELRVYAPETIGAFQNFGAATGSFDAIGHILTTAGGNGQTRPAAVDHARRRDRTQRLHAGAAGASVHPLARHARLRSLGGLRGLLHRRERVEGSLMPDVVAKTMAFICGALLLATCAVLYVTSRPQAGANEVVAEFQDAFPILEGMYVRVDGAIAGSVGPVEVTDNGLAEVTLILDETIEDPSSDATAAIRQQDTTGDSYVSFEPGDSGKPLPEVDGTPTIECGAETPQSPCQATLTAPRFDDLLNAFGPAERSGVKLILLELSRALDERGDDVNAAALELRPAMIAANEALAEVNSQNAALRAVIEDAENVTGQAAAKRAELAGLIDSLETTLVATAEESGSLDAGLERLPETTAQARSTMSSLANAAEAGVPLAREVEASAPDLASAIDAAPDSWATPKSRSTTPSPRSISPAAS